jgi:hypothetical protein
MRKFPVRDQKSEISNLKSKTMKLQIAILIIALTHPVKDFAQTQLNKSIPVQSGQKINMHFDYPELVRVST